MDTDDLSLNLVPCKLSLCGPPFHELTLISSLFPSYTVSTLLPSPYHIVYASLLLAFSVPVTFAGAFLTLDRTRSFAPSSLASTPLVTKKSKWRLEGGVGGLLGGWLVGGEPSILVV
jgi:hypothetical protein